MIVSLTSLIYTLALSHLASSKIVSFLEQGFSFDYTPTAAPVPIPTTTQCEEIPLNWGPGAFNGPSPVAPYYIQVYTSTFLFPMVINVGEGRTFNWPVPYVPGTQYQICMFASNGVTGGCQRSYTVIPAANTTLDNPPVCQNLTYPQGILDVQAQDHTGNLSQYAWVDQCTDISLKPNNGTPPFTMTVASTLHPPWNITSSDMSALNWTVQLSWASQFWVSLVDSEGLSWAFGPLHAGGNGPTDCLSLDASPTSSSGGGLSAGVAAGAGIGGIVVGLVAGAVVAWFILKRKSSQRHSLYDVPEDRIHRNTYKQEALDSPAGDHYAPVPVTVGSPRESEAELISVQRSLSSGRVPLAPGSGYEVEPFRLPDEAFSDGVSTQHHGTARESMSGGVAGGPTSRASRHGAPSEASSSSGARSPEAGSSMPHVYVVHHDGGRAPVSVFTPQGTEVIELPPRYEGGSTSATSSSSVDAAGESSRPRRPAASPLGVRNADPGPLPRKLPPSPGSRGDGPFQD
ncbi:hypothetical protein SCHPADRAFT_817175 [Schizopora paradoxa]|uniref:Fibronectin type-III domain-containing protein n=1 Tax=Schizopora paradoxa TaxID=27342 RepID=A0A0H2SE57_9AGAM|nr:hypothetical protein SCHPADRAFT_817175 [Schizopora paradoxa]